jgi:hypothetical protein
MTPEIGRQQNVPSPPEPRLPGPQWASYCVHRNSRENLLIAVGLVTFRRPRQVPGAYWYWLQRWTPRVVFFFRLWAFALVICLALMVADAILLFADSDLLHRYHWLFLSYIAVFWLQPVLVGRRAKLAFAREILEQEGMICFDCGYNLKALPESHTCPECGTPYERSDLRVRWLDWMRQTLIS